MEIPHKSSVQHENASYFVCVRVEGCTAKAKRQKTGIINLQDLCTDKTPKLQVAQHFSGSLDKKKNYQRD